MPSLNPSELTRALNQHRPSNLLHVQPEFRLDSEQIKAAVLQQLPGMQRATEVLPTVFATHVIEYSPFPRFEFKTMEKQIGSAKVEMVTLFNQTTETEENRAHQLYTLFLPESSFTERKRSISMLGQVLRKQFNTRLYSNREKLLPEDQRIWEHLCIEQEAVKTEYKALYGDPVYALNI